MDISLLKIEKEQNYVRIVPPEKIDSYTAYQIDKEFHFLLENTPVHFIFDFSSTAYIGSAGFGIFILFQKRLAERNLKMIFACPSDFIMKLMDATKFDRFFNIADSIENAIQMIGESLNE